MFIVHQRPIASTTFAKPSPTPELGTQAKHIVENISRVFVGKNEVIARAVTVLISGGHLLLEDVPGLGKTLLAKALAESISGQFKRIQFTADLLPSDVTGATIYSPENETFSFRPGPVFTNILLADEINRATPRTQSSLLEAMEEQCVTVDGQAHVLSPPFFVIATQNPVEIEGTYPLPFAQMDRFMARLSIGYLDKSAEVQMLKQQQRKDALEDFVSVVDCDTIVELQAATRAITIADELLDYVVEIVQATRKSELVEYGASPRGSLDLQRFSQAHALMNGRRYVLPDDIKDAARWVLPHRLIPRRGTRGASKAVHDAIDQILETLRVPL